MRLIDADAVDYENIACSQTDLEWLNRIIEEQPTIEVPRWIPVTERLPEKSGYYLVCHESGFISERLFYEDYPRLFKQVTKDPVTHWMSLPTPPKDGDT